MGSSVQPPPSDDCQCQDEVHRGQPCWNKSDLPHPSNRCRWCRNGH